MLQTIPISTLKGVGPSRQKLFEKIGIKTIEDLLYFFPRRYEDRRNMLKMKEAQKDQWVSLMGKVLTKRIKRSYHRDKSVFEIELSDDTGRVSCVWFNQHYLEHSFQTGDRIVVYGKLETFGQRLQIIAPEYEKIEEQNDTLNVGRIVPIYSLTKGITQKILRKLMYQALKEYGDHVVDMMPKDMLERQKLLSLKSSIGGVHFPDSDPQKQMAINRISFDEFFIFQVAVMLRRIFLKQKKGFQHFIEHPFQERFLKSLPFVLTEAQNKVLKEIFIDMKEPKPMLRLLQGDVGSGKTILAFFGCMAAVVSGYQAVFMAPTEILARQQYESFKNLFSQKMFGDVRVAFLSSHLKRQEKVNLLKQIRLSEIDVVFGTHALLQEDVEFNCLSFVAIDEQHKFGVKQRALLTTKKTPPDVLVMTATPIPRSLCLTLYGDLDLSFIDEKPKNRGDIKTYYVALKDAKGVYQQVASWIKKGTQAYVVYPVIEESETVDLKSAVEMYQRFKENEFKDFRLGLIHGRLPKEEVEETMKLFKEQKIDILLTTTILEVGIDVPTANVMIIEHAERFGLAQLHQLRGRVGRSEKNAVCVLVADPHTQEGEKRIKALIKTQDGFEIAKQDLAIRGPGQYFGRYQHGLNELGMGDPLVQQEMLHRAREEAEKLTSVDPTLKKHVLIKNILKRHYPEYLERLHAG